MSYKEKVHKNYEIDSTTDWGVRKEKRLTIASCVCFEKLSKKDLLSTIALFCISCNMINVFIWKRMTMYWIYFVRMSLWDSWALEDLGERGDQGRTELQHIFQIIVIYHHHHHLHHNHRHHHHHEDGHDDIWWIKQRLLATSGGSFDELPLSR